IKQQHSCYYIGVELNKEVAAKATGKLDKVIVGDVEKINLKDHGIQESSLDYIIYGDVLEHLYDPWNLLYEHTFFLKDGGYIIASIPNVRNLEIINFLTNGIWPYSNSGILDATHLRFFTLKEIEKWFLNCNLKIIEVKHSVYFAFNKFFPPPSPIIVGTDKLLIKNISKEELLEFVTSQFLIKAQKNNKLPIFCHNYKREILFLSIVIVTYNSLNDIKPCLHSILTNTRLPYEVIIIDNASKDGTVDYLKSIKAENIRIILNEQNLGFARAVNQGINIAKGDYIVLLNPDTIVTPHWAERMMAHFKKDVGAVGPVSNYVAGQQNLKIHVEINSLPKKININQVAEKLARKNNGKSLETKLLIGFCLMTKKEVLNKVGLLDEDFFLGSEDLEFCWRLRQKGYKLIVATDTFIYHKGHASFNTVSKREERDDLLKTSSKILYEKLESFYGKNKVPSPVELWGVDLFESGEFGPFLKNKSIKIAAVYCVYDASRWLEYSVASIYKMVDKIYFLVSTRPWKGDFFENFSTLKRIKNLPDPNKKIVLIRKEWKTETEQRNAGLEILKEENFDYCFVIDDDEIYDEIELERAIKFITRHPEISCWHISWYTYWKNWQYRIDPPEPFKPVVFVKVGKARFAKNRLVQAERHALIPPQVCMCHHMSYARTDEEIKKKLSSFSHADEIRRNWFERVWKKWDKNPKLENLHPTHPECYKRAIKVNYAELPPILRKLGQEGVEKKKVSIIVLNYNRAFDTIECVKSILNTSYPYFQIIIVDNASTDDSVKVILNSMKKLTPNFIEFIEIDHAGDQEIWLKHINFFQKEVILIKNKENLGFAGGNNIGLRYALDYGADYIWLLNNDTIVDKDALLELAKLAGRFEKGGIISSKIYSYYSPTKVQYSGDSEVNYAGFEDKKNEFPKLIKAAPGCSVLIKRKLLEEIGLLSEDYFLYFEDNELCARTLKAGWQIWYNPYSKVYHKGGASIGCWLSSPLSAYYAARNSLIYQIKLNPIEINRVFNQILKGIFWKTLKKEKACVFAFIEGIKAFLQGKKGKAEIDFENLEEINKYIQAIEKEKEVIEKKLQSISSLNMKEKFNVVGKALILDLENKGYLEDFFNLAQAMFFKEHSRLITFYGKIGEKN
ncbi:glycosyltransferase, partial [Desulfonauticus submarinus]